MANFIHPALNHVKALGMPDTQNIVISDGAAMSILGVKGREKYNDIDIVTNLENVKFLRLMGEFAVDQMIIGHDKDGNPKFITRTVGKVNGIDFDVFRWSFILERYNRTGKGRVPLDELIANSERDEDTGIYVLKPECILEHKIGNNRPNDQPSIDKLQSFISDKALKHS